MNLVQPICRDGLTEADRAFLRSVLAPGQSEAPALDQLLGDPAMRDELLDLPAVFQAVLEEPEPVRLSPRLYFYVLVRHRFQRAGLDDRELADYVASLLADSLAGSGLFTSGQGSARQALFYATDDFTALQAAQPGVRFYLTVRLAEKALVATGMFRPHLDYRATHRGAPSLRYYEGIGQAQYRVAGAHHLAQEFCLAGLYHELSECFTEARRALNGLSAEWTFLGEN